MKPPPERTRVSRGMSVPAWGGGEGTQSEHRGVHVSGELVCTSEMGLKPQLGLWDRDLRYIWVTSWKP